jgi:hypothetical protein
MRGSTRVRATSLGDWSPTSQPLLGSINPDCGTMYDSRKTMVRFVLTNALGWAVLGVLVVCFKAEAAEWDWDCELISHLSDFEFWDSYNAVAAECKRPCTIDCKDLQGYDAYSRACSAEGGVLQNFTQVFACGGDSPWLTAYNWPLCSVSQDVNPACGPELFQDFYNGFYDCSECCASWTSSDASTQDPTGNSASAGGAGSSASAGGGGASAGSASGGGAPGGAESENYSENASNAASGFFSATTGGMAVLLVLLAS